MILKEFRELRRDRRTLGMLVVMPILLLVVFGYAANFTVTSIRTAVVGPQAEQAAALLPDVFDVIVISTADTQADAESMIQDNEVDVAIVTGDAPPALALVDGSSLFTAQSAVSVLNKFGDQVTIEVLYNPDLDTAWVMVPAIIGLILTFIGTIITSIGMVRERETGTLEQLAVMPIKPSSVILGKITPYFIVASIDMIIVTLLGMWLFGVPFNGSPWLFAVGAAEFLFVVLGLGVFISTISQTTGQAIQTAFFFLLPQILLSGMIFPLEAIPWAVRWISYLLPLTYFTMFSQGVMLRGAGIDTALAGDARARRHGGRGLHRRAPPLPPQPRPRTAGEGPRIEVRGDRLMAGVFDATVRFGSVMALDDVTLVVPPGQVTMVVGGDGAGKTTLLRALVGEVVLDAGRVEAPPPEQIGYLPASSGSWKDLTVQENVDFVGSVYGLDAETLAARADRLLARADLDDVRDRVARNLSGGMRRKLGFVMAALHRPSLLVLDEPTTGVDPVSRVELWRLVAESAAVGTSVLMSTTYLDEAERAARLLVLDRGRPLLAGTPDEVLGAAPGTVTVVDAPVRREFAWRRGRRFHEWWPAGESAAAGEVVVPDMEDTVVAATLASGRTVAP